MLIESFNFELIIYLIGGISTIFFLILLIWNIRLEKRLRNLLKGKNAVTLEDTIFVIQNDLKNLENFRLDIEKYLNAVEKRLSRSIQGFHNETFDAFSGMDSGGKSFAAAFLNEKGDGILLSSLQSRDKLRVFAKQIKNYKSEIELGEEEKIALTKAKESCNL